MEHINTELDELKKKLITMASHAETAVNRAIESLVTRNVDLARQVKSDDAIIDQLEIEVDEISIHLLTKAPLASDLRFVTVTMKICQNLERVGDEAAKIAKSARRLSAEPPLSLNLELPLMAKKALDMLQAALDAFVRRDSTAARAVIPRDKEVDALNKIINSELTDHMMQNRDGIPRALSLMTATRSLERIADHAKNIAEEVVYLCEAQDIRHTKAE
ncbi:MAG TPA: phosphate signaling complex protein PhoU [Candidatus Acidoferrum sp.]|nr:phosphate signaling complex protein PhoU [Candidatus Acidoferrum sp.]